MRPSLIAFALQIAVTAASGQTFPAGERKAAGLDNPAAQNGVAGKPIRAFFACDAGKTVNAVFTNGAQSSVRLTLSDGREMSVPQVLSGSGARYANGDESFVFWNKGNTAFIEESGKRTYRGCTTKG